jgi:hypothetical protein
MVHSLATSSMAPNHGKSYYTSRFAYCIAGSCMSLVSSTFHESTCAYAFGGRMWLAWMGAFFFQSPFLSRSRDCSGPSGQDSIAYQYCGVVNISLRSGRRHVCSSQHKRLTDHWSLVMSSDTSPLRSPSSHSERSQSREGSLPDQYGVHYRQYSSVDCPP